MQWAPRSDVAPSAGALSRRGVPPLPSGQESRWITPSGLPSQSYQQIREKHQVTPRPTGYPVAHVSPGVPPPIDPRKKVVIGRLAMPQDSDVHFLGCKRNLSHKVPQSASTSMQSRTGVKVQEEIRQFIGVMQQYTHNMQVPHRSHTDRPTYQSQNCGQSMERRHNILQSQNQHNPGLPWHQSPENSQRDMNQLGAKASSASLGSGCMRMPPESSSIPFKIPTLGRDHRTVYNSSSQQISVTNVIESTSRVDFITSSEIITSPVTSPDALYSRQSVSSAVSFHPTHLNNNSYQQPSGNTQPDAHESSEPVTDLRTAPNDKAHFKPPSWSSEAQAIRDPTVSSTRKSPVSNQHESPTINEKTDITENVDVRKNSDNVPTVSLLKPPKRMFSRKGKCLSGLFRKAPQGFPHVSFDFDIYCFLCCRMAAGNNVYEHMFFGNLKCIECDHVVRSCEDFKIVRHSNVECGVSKRKHRLASWADCPVEFLVYSVKQSLVPNRLEDCSLPSTSDVTTELRNYMEKLSLLRFYKPWKTAFRRCSEYVKSMNRTEIDSVLSEDTQEVIKREGVDNVTPGDTEEEIVKEKVNNVILGDAQEEINMANVRGVFPRETLAEINREEINSNIQKDTQEEISRQEISMDKGRTTCYDLISSQSERQEEPQIEGIRINEALDQYQEHSQISTNDTVIGHHSTSDRVIIGVKQEAREGTFNFQMFENVLQDGDKDAHDNDTSQVSNDHFKDGDTTGTYTQDPVIDTQQQPTLWEPDDDDTHANMVEETETCESFQDEISNRISENQAYEKSFELSERLSTRSPEPEDNQVVYYYPNETPPEECPMCYYTLCATMFTLNMTNFRVSTECPDCSLKICIVFKDFASSKKPKRFRYSL